MRCVVVVGCGGTVLLMLVLLMLMMNDSCRVVMLWCVCFVFFAECALSGGEGVVSDDFLFVVCVIEAADST